MMIFCHEISQHCSLHSSSTKSLTGGNMAEGVQTTLHLGKYSRDRISQKGDVNRDSDATQVCLFLPLTDYLQLDNV